jgi:hypothetical protein
MNWRSIIGWALVSTPMVAFTVVMFMSIGWLAGLSVIGVLIALYIPVIIGSTLIVKEQTKTNMDEPSRRVPYRDYKCTCPEHHDPFLMDAHHGSCYYERHSPDAND